MKAYKHGALRVWHIPQIPMDGFLVDVGSEAEAIKVLDVLADYDLFQLENRIKPDFSNAQGLEVFDADGWSEYYNDDGEDIDDIRER